MAQNFRMIDVGDKQITKRKAVATGKISVCSETMEMIRKGDSPKGNILAMAEVAGIMAAKNTAFTLPLCHPLMLDSVKIWFDIQAQHVVAFCEVICHGKTGVEMEALVGLNACLLTIYDLAKAVDPVIEISDVFLQTKEGGKSGLWQHPRVQSQPSIHPEKKMSFAQIRFAVGTLSDRASKGVYHDESGPILVEYLNEQGADKIFYKVIADEAKILQQMIQDACQQKVDVLLLTGGTGISARDITPEIVRSMSSKELSGFGELQRQYGSRFTKASWLSRSSAFVVESTLVVLFPGSPKAVRQGLEAIGELIPHAIKMMRGEAHSKQERIGLSL